jgi:hypothetical protein
VEGMVLKKRRSCSLFFEFIPKCRLSSPIRFESKDLRTNLMPGRLTNHFHKLKMLKRLYQLLNKSKVATRMPLKLKKHLLSFSTSLFVKSYDNLMMVIDRATSIVFVLLYDFFSLMINKKGHASEVLLCRYCYFGDSGIESIEKFTLEDTLVNYLGDRNKIAVYYWDKDQPLFGFGIKFYRKVAKLNPKYLVLSSYAPGVFYQPMPWILARLKKRNVRIVALWWDTCGPSFAKSISSVIDTIDVQVIMENPTLNFGASREAQLLKEKARGLFSAFDLELEKRKRDIDVAFLGQISAYRSVRRAYLDFLLENNVSLHYSAFEKNQQCSNEKYYEILSRAKIGINFSMSVDKHQLKARVFETMQAGGMLLEERNEQTAYYFTEGVEYVAFSSESELLEKIHYYLANENERLAIALAGHRKVRKLFSGKQFWDNVLSS